MGKVSPKSSLRWKKYDLLPLKFLAGYTFCFYKPTFLTEWKSLLSKQSLGSLVLSKAHVMLMAFGGKKIAHPWGENMSFSPHNEYIFHKYVQYDSPSFTFWLLTYCEYHWLFKHNLGALFDRKIMWVILKGVLYDRNELDFFCSLPSTVRFFSKPNQITCTQFSSFHSKIPIALWMVWRKC